MANYWMILFKAFINNIILSRNKTLPLIFKKNKLYYVSKYLLKSGFNKRFLQ